MRKDIISDGGEFQDTKENNLEKALFVRLLFDIMIPAELASSIRDSGYDVAEARKLPKDIYGNDERLLKVAVTERRALFTCNFSDPFHNFCLIDAAWKLQGKQHAGIILCPQTDISLRRWEVWRRLLQLLDTYSWDELYNRLIWLPPLGR